MEKRPVQYFFLGVLIAFTISVLTMSAIMTISSADAVLSVKLIWQALVLSILCSLINLIYQLERLKFIWQSVICYILTTATILTCGLAFEWFSFGGNRFEKTDFVLWFFVICSCFYFVTWIIIWRIMKAKKRTLNRKLEEYKKRQ